MSSPSSRPANRRKFLQFLAGSPLFAFAGAAGLSLGTRSLAWSAEALGIPGAPGATPADALNVFDLEAVARTNLPVAHFAYLATSVEGDVTLRANREGFAKFQIRARRLECSPSGAARALPAAPASRGSLVNPRLDRHPPRRFTTKRSIAHAFS